MLDLCRGGIKYLVACHKSQNTITAFKTLTEVSSNYIQS